MIRVISAERFIEEFGVEPKQEANPTNGSGDSYLRNGLAESIVVEVEPDDPRNWEFIRLGEGENEPYAVAADDNQNRLYIYRKLPHPSKVQKYPTGRDFRLLYVVGDDLEYKNWQISDLPAHIKLERLDSLNKQALQDALLQGMDGIVLACHGSGGVLHLIDPENSTAATQVSPAELATFVQQSGYPLRFATFPCCTLHKELLTAFSQLSNENVLHPQFAGMLFWGEPFEAGAAAMLRQMFHFLKQSSITHPYAFLELMRWLQKGDYEVNSALPNLIAMASHPMAVPLPTLTEWELELLFRTDLAPE